MKYPKFLTLILAVAIFAGCKSSEVGMDDAAEATPEPTKEEMIISEHIAAMGGLEALSQISSVRTSGEVEMPAMDMTLLITIYQKAPRKMRIEVDIPQMGAQVLNGYDGETAWESNPMGGGVMKLDGDRERAFREQADLDGMLVGAEEDGYTVTYLGDEEVKGAMNHKMKVMRADSSEVILYLDAEAKTETLIEAEAPNPMTGAMTTVQTFRSDYREVSGTKMAYRTEVVIDGQTFQSVTIKDIRINVPVDDSIFTMPAE